MKELKQNLKYLNYLIFSLIMGFCVSVMCTAICYIFDFLFISLKTDNIISEYQWYWSVLLSVYGGGLLAINSLFIAITFIMVLIYSLKIKKHQDIKKIKRFIDLWITWTGFFSFYYYWNLYKKTKLNEENKNWRLICSLKTTILVFFLILTLFFASLAFLDYIIALVINGILLGIIVVKVIVFIVLIYYRKHQLTLNKPLSFFQKYGRYMFLDAFFQ